MFLPQMRSTEVFVVASLALLLASAPGAMAQNGITRASVGSNGEQSNRDCYSPTVSGNGRYVAFQSPGDTLVPNDFNWSDDVFVRDLLTGTTVRVSVDAAGNEGDNSSGQPSISWDGRYVAFAGDATNLVSDDTNTTSDIFVHDRDPDGNGIFDEGNGTTVRVSVDSDGNQGDGGIYLNGCGYPSISADGTRVAFNSGFANLVANDTNDAGDIFVHDLVTGETIRVSVDSNGVQANKGVFDLSHLSFDGRVVAFSGYSDNLVANDTNHDADGFVHDLVTLVTERVTVGTGGVQGDRGGFVDALSADGAIVAFTSGATNLVSGDTNHHSDVFLRDRIADTTVRISLSMAGLQSDGESGDIALSSDGRFVAYSSDATNLITGDLNHTADVLIYDRVTGHTTVSSVGLSAAVGNGWSWSPSLSADGGVLVFNSGASDLVAGDTNDYWDTFAQDRSALAPASWQNYGAGLAGTFGIPALTARIDPVLGATLTIDVGNSLGGATIGFLAAGLAPGSLPLRGGTLLVDSIVLVIPLTLDAGGAAIAADLPIDPALAGFALYAQALELDPGAKRGMSFTAGLETVFGY